MSTFRVNTNILSINAYRNLTETNTNLGRSITRLSTGLRINSGGDDPAGLVASESFRAQISGLQQALRNNQDAINFVKTAEGALDEVSRLLRDARGLAVSSANGATVTTEQRQANDNQLRSIVASITRISTQTQFGTKRVLDGSAGTYGVSTAATDVLRIATVGTWSGTTISTNSTVTVQMTTAAVLASTVGTKTYGALSSLVSAGEVTINGQTIRTVSTDTVQNLLDRINALSSVTGVVGSFSGTFTLRHAEYGSLKKIDFTESTGGVINSSAGHVNVAGTDSIGTVTINPTGSSAVSKTFNKGYGLQLRDDEGNVIDLSEVYGTAVSAAAAKGTIVNSSTSQFQIGANVNQTTSINISNVAATELGKGVVGTNSLNDASLLTISSSNDAMKIIDKAIDDISSLRGRIGNFQRNILESNLRSLSIANENLSATESAIRDLDIAAEMTIYTKYQILQQSGLSVLAQANAAPQGVLQLLRGG